MLDKIKTKEITGFLYSQIGYDLGDPMRALIRSTRSKCISEGTIFEVRDYNTGEVILAGNVSKWGEIWGSIWWEIDFSQIDMQGQYKIVVKSGEHEIFSSDEIKIGKYLLWDETVTAVALDQMEERVRRARNHKGWNDCGAPLLRELNSHATTVIGLCDLLRCGFRGLCDNDVERLLKQIIHGCDYLALCQDKARINGCAEGSMVHEINQSDQVIPGDIAQSIVAFAYSSRMICDVYLDKCAEYLNRAEKSFRYLYNTAEPHGSDGFSHMNHGAPEGFNVPREWMTRDLIMMMWGAFELYLACGRKEYKEAAVSLARRITKRQVPEESKEGEFYGHFYTFDSCDFTEKANVHHHVGHDTGATFPHYLVPFMQMWEHWRDHPDAPLWRKAVKDFAYGYFLPACSKNPFYLLPEGYFKEEGLLVFCGPWHGINTSIAFAATLAINLEYFLGDGQFRKIAAGNLQWIAGLNAGITCDSFKGCVKWKEEVPEGIALPYSQIYGIGKRYTGSWSNIRGNIPNGFDTNPQFQLVVKPTRENDGPWLYTDEDWIPHGAGWISALACLRQRKSFWE